MPHSLPFTFTFYCSTVCTAAAWHRWSQARVLHLALLCTAMTPVLGGNFPCLSAQWCCSSGRPDPICAPLPAAGYKLKPAATTPTIVLANSEITLCAAGTVSYWVSSADGADTDTLPDWTRYPTDEEQCAPCGGINGLDVILSSPAGAEKYLHTYAPRKGEQTAGSDGAASHASCCARLPVLLCPQVDSHAHHICQPGHHRTPPHPPTTAGMSMCIPCPAGKIPNSDWTACTACSGGTYHAASTVSASCTSCEAGKEIAASGYQACTLW